MFMLQRWSDVHRQPFADMQSDPEVMADLGGPFSRADSDRKFDRYRDAWRSHGVSRWAVVDASGNFLGYAGVMKAGETDHPLGPHYEIGWRFRRRAWGSGFATESARQALEHAWTVLTVDQIFSYTAADNHRSQAVMKRLGLTRDIGRDFTARYPQGLWSGLVWTAQRPVQILIKSQGCASECIESGQNSSRDKSRAA
ncbi:GNAT family N-acetyltransferase [Sandaracinobacteroides saxicola]|uniref:GNAT family N-acetyltransferase n=1 Tax=Sandaracinobacteroides saxicola TaxID=2759707 RepID=A0A7G5IJF7_9SPHN|nr:GNAT family N-acetyltransferase [Sandaracinobacteroides saxicola]QMW23499.1 GNAT family N-acetyltransferase [Sandaracinobacteroides saxicola]